ncbi:type 1 glutamine amidotransferase [Neptuniibacter halophilus]|uniref:type 1 glutamine amidotransferase n=1 Tax=Neptuniibacter halophilus TaxID=651666 RepID=UPI002573D384|nr:type 1 glutamine amidotransferase [Neptuniibacter halophilus]
MKTGILITGDTKGELKQRYGSFADMFMALLRQADPDLEFACFDLLKHEFPDNPQQCDSWLITGSEHGVYDNLPWMAPLQQFIREVAAAGVPMVGICFGHQIMAAALGARVEKSDKGWGLGPQRYQIEGIAEQSSVVLNAIHQDQVLSLPPQGKVFMRSEFCPYAGVCYGESMMSIQAHPEFMADFTAEQLLELKGNLFPEALTDAAIQRLQQPEWAADTDLVRRLMLNLLRPVSV